MHKKSFMEKHGKSNMKNRREKIIKATRFFILDLLDVNSSGSPNSFIRKNSE